MVPVRKLQWRYPFQNFALYLVGLLYEDYVGNVGSILGDGGITAARVSIPVGDVRVD